MTQTSPTIIETLAGQFFRVTDYASPDLAHVWEGVEVKRSKGGFVDKKNARPFSVRKIGTRVVAQQAPVAMVPQLCQQQQAQAVSDREASAARVSIDRLRAKADAASNPVEARRLNAAADRISSDLTATAPFTHIIHFTIPRRGSADERILAETPVGDTAASVVEYLSTDQLNDRVLTAVYAADLTENAERLINVTAAILRDVAAYVEAAAIELPRSLDDAFTRHGIPQPMAWVEANALRDLEFEEHRLGPADCLDRRRAA